MCFFNIKVVVAVRRKNECWKVSLLKPNSHSALNSMAHTHTRQTGHYRPVYLGGKRALCVHIFFRLRVCVADFYRTESRQVSFFSGLIYYLRHNCIFLKMLVVS